MTTTKQYDYMNRLLGISSQPGASGLAPIAFSYLYNDANQRIRRTDPDGSGWGYEYDSLGQLISGKRQWQDATPVAGQQLEYAFDDIGNRTSTKAGGDHVGTTLRSAAYSANALNQYTSRDVPPYVEVQGIANANASVTVNGQTAYRRGEYYRSELNPDNSASALWLAVTNIASLTGTNQTNTGSLFLPRNAEAFAFDADGNTTNDGRFSYSWDAENRLTLAESHASAPTGSKRKVSFEYDGGGRLVRRVEYDGSSGSYVLASDTKFVRDAWQPLAEINGTNGQRLRSYLWGLDLSGSLTGAGGVGGLLAMNSASSGAHFYAYDGNGNVAGLVSATDGTRTASQEYDPFGRSLRNTGTAAAENSFRFSTKRADDALDLVGYEYRSYNPVVGRWVNRDPMQEDGGVNLYGFVANDSGNEVDPFGLDINTVYRAFCDLCGGPQFGGVFHRDRQALYHTWPDRFWLPSGITVTICGISMVTVTTGGSWVNVGGVMRVVARCPIPINNYALDGWRVSDWGQILPCSTGIRIRCTYRCNGTHRRSYADGEGEIDPGPL